MSSSLKGNPVGMVYLVRLGLCQFGSKTEQCPNKTRMGIGVPVVDDPELLGCRICGSHLEVFIESIRKVAR